MLHRTLANLLQTHNESPVDRVVCCLASNSFRNRAAVSHGADVGDDSWCSSDTNREFKLDGTCDF